MARHPAGQGLDQSGVALPRLSAVRYIHANGHTLPVHHASWTGPRLRSVDGRRRPRAKSCLQGITASLRRWARHVLHSQESTVGARLGVRPRLYPTLGHLPRTRRPERLDEL